MAVTGRENWGVLEPLIDQALDLTPDERAKWLDALRARSPDLAAEVDSLLSAESTADERRFLLDPLEFTLAGVQLGAYTLERPLGRGGMGSVWLARRTDGSFEGRAAVKILNLARLGATGQLRFRREGSMLARLTHPGIARLLDAGVAPSGQPYLVLEHVDGQSIDAFVNERALPLEDRVRLFLQVLAAVGHAHANLVIHRDLKPSNILVTAAGSVKLLDFGIATLLDAERSAITIEDGTSLTPEFAAPEQARDEGITTATDVYALGALLYLLVSGRHPTAEGCRTAVDVVRALLEVEPARLGLGDLDTVLAKALRKPPEERYQTVAAFADDLERYLRHELVSARPHSAAYRVRTFVRRNRAVVGVVALIATSLTTATVFSLRQMKEATRQRDEAVRYAKRSGAMSEVQSVLASDLRDASGRSLSAAERISLAEGVLTRQYTAEPWLVAEVMVDLAGRYYDAGDLVSERALLARARDIARRSGATAQLALANCQRVYSFAYDDVFDSARTDLAEAKAALREPGVLPEPALEAACLAGEGKLLVAEGQTDSAVAVLERAVKVTTNDPQGTLRLQVLNDLGEVLRIGGRPREAIPYQREVVVERERTGYAETSMFPNNVTFLFASMRDLGEHVAADSLLRAAIRRYETAGVDVGAPSAVGAVDGVAERVPAMLSFLYGHGKLRLGILDSADTWIARAMRDTTSSNWRTNWLPEALTDLRLEQRRYADARKASQFLASGTRGRRATAALLRARIRRADGDTSGAATLLESELHALATDGQKSLWLFALPYVAAGEWRLARGDARGADSLARLAVAAAALDSAALRLSGHVGRANLLHAQSLRVLGDRVGARDAARQAVAALTNGYGAQNARAAEARLLLDSLAR